MMSYFTQVVWLLLLITMLNGCNTPSPAEDIAPLEPMPTVTSAAVSEPAPANQTAQPSVVFTVSGGPINFCDTLSIKTDGEFLMQKPCADYELSGTLIQADLATFEQWQQQIDSIGYTNTVADLTTTLSFTGHGATTLPEEQRQILLDWLNGLLVRMQPPPETPAPPEPMAVGAEGICPTINRPAMLIDNYESPYQLFALDSQTQEQCDILLSHPPMGPLASGGGNLYYPVLDEAAKTITLWRLALDGSQMALPFTEVSFESYQPYSFIVSDDGSQIAWGRAVSDAAVDETQPLYRNDLWVANSDGSDLRALLSEVENEEGRYISPVRFSADGTTLFYALQPSGINGSPLSYGGRYDTLYSIPTTGGEATLRHACTESLLCIGDVSADGTVVAYVNVTDGTINVVREDGAIVNSVSGPGLNYLGQPMFAPDGTLAFISITLSEGTENNPPSPNPSTISILPPPYLDEPQTLYAANDVVTLWEWMDSTQLAYGATTIDTFSIGVGIVSTDGQAIKLTPNFPLGVWR